MKAVLLLVLVSLAFAAAAEFFPTCSTGYSVAFYGGLNGKPQYPFSQALQNVVDGDLFGVRAEIDLLNDAGEVQGVLLFVEDDYYLHSRLREFEAVPGEPQHVYLQLSMFQNVASSLANGLRFAVTWSTEGCDKNNLVKGYTTVASCSDVVTP